MKPKPYWRDLTLHALPTNNFLWNNETRCMSIEVNMLPGFRLHQLYDDACDVGIALRSHRTGKVERFVLSKVDKDRNGEDIYGWNFTPEDPACGVKSVLIIND